MGRRADPQVETFGVSAGPDPRQDRQTVERRIRLSPLTARKMAVAAAIRGATESELIEWALLPHLAFDLPELPDVRVSALPTSRGRAGDRDAPAA